MKPILVKRDELLEKISANRERHREIFLKAQEIFRERVIEELDRLDLLS